MRQGTGHSAAHLKFLNELYGNCHRARPAALLSPEDVAATAAEQYPSLRARGWALQAVLDDEDIELMASQDGPQPMRFNVIELDRGLPLCVLVTQVGVVQWRWVVPMWEHGAMDWLREAIEQDRLLMLVESPTSTTGLTFLAGGGLFGRPKDLLTSATPKSVSAEEAVFGMVLGGMKVMAPLAVLPPAGQRRPKHIRVMVAARGVNAVLLMETYQRAMYTRPAGASSAGTEVIHSPLP